MSVRLLSYLTFAALLVAPGAVRGDGKPAPGAAGSDRAHLLPAGGKPLDGTLEDLAGKPALLSSLRGHPVLLDFFATWCEPCRVGLPRTDALVASHANKGLVGWAVSLDDDPAPVAPFIARLELKLPVRWDRGGKTADALGIELLPALLLLDSTGAVRYRVSPDDRDAERHLQEAVEALLQ